MIRRFWPRLVEGALGVWLVASQWVLGAPADPAAEVLGVDAVPVVLGVMLVALMLVSFRYRRAQAAILATGALVVLLSWLLHPRPGPPSAENAIIVGLVVCLFALVPNEPGLPPVRWRPYVRTPREPPL